MRAYLIIIFQIRHQHMSEVPLSEHNNVVKAFPSDRTDQPFGTSILPRGAWRRWSVANAHRSKSSDEDIAIGPIAIADQIVGSPFPAESFRNLICNPFCGRMRSDAEPYDLSSAVPHDQQAVEQTKRDCRHDEQIHRGDAVGMIVKERFPPLRGRASAPDHSWTPRGPPSARHCCRCWLSCRWPDCSRSDSRSRPATRHSSFFRSSHAM